jgi:D-3-phosphoglycerate dehydrogenase / 2-oxoglutarate reductase
MKKKVVRFDFWINPVFDEHLAKFKDIDLTICRYADDDKKTLVALKEAQIYHICAARDEVPKQWWLGEELLKQLPNLLCASASILRRATAMVCWSSINQVATPTQ